MDTQTLQRKIGEGPVLLDGATGSCLRAAGMPRDAVTELWVLEHPAALEKLQLAYRQAGCRILLAPTLQAQELVLGPLGYDVEKTNARLVRLTRSFAGQECLVAGNLGPLAGSMDSWNEARSDRMTEIYRCQIGGLLEGGVDLIMAETLLYPLEAACIARAAELEGSQTAVCYTFTMQPDGTLFSGREAGAILRELERASAAAVGFNCVAAGQFLASLTAKLRRYVRGPLISKPNAGNPTIGPDGMAHYPMGIAEFVRYQLEAQQMGATLLGGCCGTDPTYLAALGAALAQRENPKKEF